MLFEPILFEKFPEATLTPMCFTNPGGKMFTPRRAVIVCPGGGYKDLSRREAEPIDVKFMSANFATFILRYSTGEGAKDFAPLKPAALAIKYVREHANEYNVDPDYVFICGLSAGGHLAASSGVLWAHDAVKSVIGEENLVISRPTGMILGYPVITAGEWAHRSSFNRLCGKENPTKEELDQFSLELHVSEITRPAFLWHTFADGAVPVQNSLLFADAMTKAGENSSAAYTPVDALILLWDKYPTMHAYLLEKYEKVLNPDYSFE
jgi:acetyl esterase/lipase